MAKPPSDDPRRHTVSVRMTDSERESLDAKRGGLSASDFIRKLIEGAR